VGYNYAGTVSDSYATGNVSDTGSSSSAGGLVGYNSSGTTVKYSYATGSVSGSGSNSDIGGLVGINSSGTVSDSYATGSVSDIGGDIGGLVGYNNSSGTVSDSYATGNVSGSSYSYIGGLVGENINSSTISDSYATGTVSGGSDNYVGGLVGDNHSGTVSDSYATGNVSGSSYSIIGGLVGDNYAGTVSDSYATGNVSGSSYSDIGGLAGANSSGTVTNSYWDTTSNSTGIGVGSTSGATGLSSSAMLQYTNFSGFNIYDPDTGTGSYSGNSNNSVWIQYNGQSFPLLRVFMHALTVTANNDTTTYSGSAYTTAPSGVTYSPSGYNASEVSGKLSYWDYNTNSAPVNVGTYGLSGLYSTSQNGYIMIYNGTLTITPAPLKPTTFPDIFQAIYNQTGYSGDAGIVYESLSSYYASGGTTGGINALLPYTGLPYTGRPVIINGTYRKIRFFSITKEKNGERLIKLFY
jgi:hypothetical protein